MRVIVSVDLDNKNIWRSVLESLKVSVSDATYKTWVSQTHLSELTKFDDRFVASIGCNSSFVKATLESRYFGMIQDTLAKELEKTCDLLFIVKTNPDTASKNSDEVAPLFESATIPGEEFETGMRRSGLRPSYTFENFAVSSSNQMAHAAAEAVAKEPGQAYNPLFIWGGVGVGKTHLMSSVGYFLLRKNLNLPVLLCTGEQFTNDIVEGIRNKTTQKGRKRVTV